MSYTITVGLDVHAESITAAILDLSTSRFVDRSRGEGDSQEAEVITFPSDLMKVRRLFDAWPRKDPSEPVMKLPGQALFCSVLSPEMASTAM